jgi:hypothetical protein
MTQMHTSRPPRTKPRSWTCNPKPNGQGTKEELTTDRVVDLLQTQESEVGLSAKRIREEVKVNFTGGFSGHSYDQEQDFDGNKAGFPNVGDNSTPWKSRNTAEATGSAERVSARQG